MNISQKVICNRCDKMTLCKWNSVTSFVFTSTKQSVKKEKAYSTFKTEIQVLALSLTLYKLFNYSEP